MVILRHSRNQSTSHVVTLVLQLLEKPEGTGAYKRSSGQIMPPEVLTIVQAAI